MTDKMKVYTKVLKTMKQMLPTMPENRVVVLAMLVAGIVTGRKAQLSEISLNIPHTAKPESLVKRFHRFVKNDHIEPETVYMPFVDLILEALSDAPLLIAIDGSIVGRGCLVLMVGVIYKQRLLPLSWTVYQRKKGHLPAEEHIKLLKRLKKMIPGDTEVVLLGDAEFDSYDLLDWLSTEANWSFVCRTDPRLYMTHAGQQYQIRELLAGEDTVTAVTNAAFTQNELPNVTVIAWWGKGYKKPIYLVSNRENFIECITFYKQRFKIETMFSDQKSRGFHIHKSHLAIPKRISRLLIAAALAYIWMVYLGVMVAHDTVAKHQIDRTHRTDKSLFRLGLDWLKYALTRGLNFDVIFKPPVLAIGIRQKTCLEHASSVR